MSIKRLQHLKEWEIIYIPYKRIKNKLDADDGLYFRDPHDHPHWITDWSQFYTPDDLKKLANDGMPKQGEMIEARYKTECGVLSNWFLVKFVCSYEWKLLVDTWMRIIKYDEWRYKKTELTLAEVESRLGLDTWSLKITDCNS